MGCIHVADLMHHKQDVQSFTSDAPCGDSATFRVTHKKNPQDLALRTDLVLQSGIGVSLWILCQTWGTLETRIQFFFPAWTYFVIDSVTFFFWKFLFVHSSIHVLERKYSSSFSTR